MSFAIAIYAALCAAHPLLPWAILSALAFGVDKLLDRTGATEWMRARLPFGGAAADAFDRLPMVVFGAAFSAVTLGDVSVAMAVYGAASALVMPVLMAARKHLVQLLGGALTIAACVGQAGCGLLPAPKLPDFTDDQAECLAIAEARADARLAACGDRVDGECSTDAIVDAQEAEIEKECDL